MQIDVDRLKSVKPNLSSAKKHVQSARSIVSGISIPSDFECAGTIRQIPQFLSLIEERIGNLGNWIDTSVSKFQEVQNKNDNILNGLQNNPIFKLFASVGNVTSSAVKGAGSLLEHLVDGGAIILTGANTVATGASDITSWAINKARGKNSKLQWAETKKAWKNTMSFVSNDYVGSSFNKFYDSKLGKFIDKSAYKPFKHNGVVSNTVSGVTEVAGIALITALTGGIAGIGAGTSASAATAAGISGMAGFGKYTGKAWNTLSKKDGNKKVTLPKVLKSIGNGILNGAWEGAQWFLGAKLGNLAIKGSKAGTAALRIGINSSANAADTPFRALTDSLLTGKKFKDSWKKEGGLTSLLTNFGIGLIGSTFGEILNWHKNGEVQAELSEGNNLNQNIKNQLEENIEITKTRHKKYLLEEHPDFGITEKEIDDVYDTIVKCKSDEEFQNLARQMTSWSEDDIAHVDAFRSIKYDLIVLRPGNPPETIAHEGNHGLGYFLYLNHGSTGRGMNEAATEMIALQINGINGIGDSGYRDNVAHLRDIKNILSSFGINNVIEKSYFAKNLTDKLYFEALLNVITGRKDFYKDLIEAMDYADGQAGLTVTKGEIKGANIHIDVLVTELEDALKKNIKLK